MKCYSCPQGSEWVNSLYGAVRRPGIAILGIALLGTGGNPAFGKKNALFSLIPGFLLLNQDEAPPISKSMDTADRVLQHLDRTKPTQPMFNDKKDAGLDSGGMVVQRPGLAEWWRLLGQQERQKRIQPGFNDKREPEPGLLEPEGLLELKPPNFVEPKVGLRPFVVLNRVDPSLPPGPRLHFQPGPSVSTVLSHNRRFVAV